MKRWIPLFLSFVGFSGLALSCDLKYSSVELRLNGTPLLEAHAFSIPAQQRFRELTQQNIGKKLEVVLFGKTMVTPPLETSSEIAKIGEALTKKEAMTLVKKLQKAIE